MVIYSPIILNGVQIKTNKHNKYNERLYEVNMDVVLKDDRLG